MLRLSEVDLDSLMLRDELKLSERLVLNDSELLVELETDSLKLKDSLAL